MMRSEEEEANDQHESSSSAADRADSMDCARCSSGHLERSNSDDPCEITNANLCPCCHQALGAFRSWIDEDEWQAPSKAITASERSSYGKRTAKFKHPHHSHRQNIHAAIDNYGCRLCVLLLGPYFPRSNLDKPALPLFCSLFLYFEAPMLDDYYDSYRHYNFRIALGTERQMDWTSMLYLLPLSQLDFDKHDLERATVKSSSDYTSSLSQAKAWLKECLHSHAHCEIDTGSRLVNPTRLISIHGPHIHLCSGPSLPSGTPYVTLSHCWGSLEILTLTKRNLEEFHSKINLNDLCKSFQDAIRIARELGYDYLWIDSLCIIQDSEADWKQESTTMTQAGLEFPHTICADVFQIYGNSSLNIAATGASDGSEGCFLERASALQQKFDIGLFIGGKLRGFRFFDTLLGSLNLESQPLYKRAWTVQERILPVRTLHFSEWELFWECRTKSVCESFPDDRLSPDRYGNFEKQKSLSWETVVMLYSGGKLAKSNDKLVAVSGIARSYGASEDYLAGMWRPGLEYMLRWFKKGGESERTPRLYRAPSWSWASMNGQVKFAHNLQKLQEKSRLCATVKSAWTDYIDGNPFGEVRGGVLQLECQLLLPIRPMQLTNPDGLFYEFDQSRKIPKSKLWTWVGLKWDHHDDYDEANFNNSVYFVPILEHTIYYDALKSMEGLLLRSTDGKRGEYRRIGWFHIAHSRPGVGPHDDWDWLEAAISEFKLSSNELKENEYISFCTDEGGAPRVLIEII